MTEAHKAYFDTLRSRDIDAIRAKLEENPNLVHAADPNCFNYRLLNYGAWMDRRDYVDLAIEFGADVDAPSEFWAGDWTALQHALNYNNRALAQYLVERGATIDAHAAAGLPDLDRLNTLLDEDPALVHKRGGDGTLPLHFAADTSAAAVLLDRGANVDAIDVDHHSTAAQWAANHRPEVSRYLVSKGAKPDVFMAVCSADLEWLQQLLDENPDAVHHRVTAEHFPPPDDRFCSIYVFTRGVGENATPLHAASSRKNADMVAYLIDKGADVNARGAYDDAAPLHTAAWNNDMAAITVLVDRGADINMESGQIHGNTPLGWATVSGAVDAVEFLVAKGAEMRDHYLPDIEAGIRGEHRDYSAAKTEDYEAIKKIIVDASE